MKQSRYSPLSRLLTHGPSHLEGLKLSLSHSLKLYLLSFLHVQFSSLSPSGSDLRNPVYKHCYTVVEKVSGSNSSKGLVHAGSWSEEAIDGC